MERSYNANPKKYKLREGHFRTASSEVESSEKSEVDVENEAKFFEFSQDLLCIADFNGNLLHLNPAWTHRLGWSKKLLKSKPFIAFVHPEDRHATLNEVSSLRTGHEIIWFENRYRRSDGTYAWLNWNAHAIGDDHCIFATARDVTRQKELEYEILTVADTEKQSLGRELHDGVCQTLAGISALSSTLVNQLSTGPCTEHAPAAARIASLLKDVIGQTRNVARDLYAPGFNEKHLEEAISTVAINVQNLFHINCHVIAVDDFPSVSNQVKHHILRIVQESINNAVTHGKAHNIAIRLSAEGYLGHLQIEDDGVGFNPNTLKPSGIGLKIMNYRARLIRATLDVGSGTIAGTCVECYFPLPSLQGKADEELE